MYPWCPPMLDPLVVVEQRGQRCFEPGNPSPSERASLNAFRAACDRVYGGGQPRLIVPQDSQVVWKMSAVMRSPMIGSAIGNPRAMNAVDTMMPCLLYTSPSPRDGLLS